jgi:hypothetical protein
MTQQKCDELAEEKGFKSVTLNADGSVTYVMSKAQHNNMMDELRESIKQGLSGIIASGDYPNYVSIEPNDDYTKFVIVTKSDEVDFMESIGVLAFYMYGGMYNAFNGTPTENITVSFVNEASGQVIHEANSRDAN